MNSENFCKISGLQLQNYTFTIFLNKIIHFNKEEKVQKCSILVYKHHDPSYSLTKASKRIDGKEKKVEKGYKRATFYGTKRERENSRQRRNERQSWKGEEKIEKK